MLCYFYSNILGPLHVVLIFSNYSFNILKSKTEVILTILCVLKMKFELKSQPQKDLVSLREPFSMHLK